MLAAVPETDAEHASERSNTVYTRDGEELRSADTLVAPESAGANSETLLAAHPSPPSAHSTTLSEIRRRMRSGEHAPYE